MVVNFIGLTGPQGVLPLVYTQLVRDRIRDRDLAMRDFFDLFNHRVISLFYRAWEKYRFAIAYEKGRDNLLSRYLLDLVGLGTRGLQDRQAVADESFIFYAGLMSQRPRSAKAVQQVLIDYFDVPVRIEQFAGAWYPLSASDQCRLGEGEGISADLGIGSVVGDEVWHQQSRVRIRLGPLTLRQYLDFLPGGPAHLPLRALARFFAAQELEFEAQLVLRREETPRCTLGEEGDGAARLGWVTWANTRGMDRDPADTVLRL
jgi:type VI secretion system protein ImpH